MDQVVFFSLLPSWNPGKSAGLEHLGFRQRSAWNAWAGGEPTTRL